MALFHRSDPHLLPARGYAFWICTSCPHSLLGRLVLRVLESIACILLGSRVCRPRSTSLLHLCRTQQPLPVGYPLLERMYWSGLTTVRSDIRCFLCSLKDSAGLLAQGDLILAFCQNALTGLIVLGMP